MHRAVILSLLGLVVIASSVSKNNYGLSTYHSFYIGHLTDKYNNIPITGLNTDGKIIVGDKATYPSTEWRFKRMSNVTNEY